jgi:hypothetical protein
MLKNVSAVIPDAVISALMGPPRDDRNRHFQQPASPPAVSA